MIIGVRIRTTARQFFVVAAAVAAVVIVRSRPYSFGVPKVKHSKTLSATTTTTTMQAHTHVLVQTK